jgi:hypothetical protein
MVLSFFFVKTSLFISLCIWRDLSQQKISRESYLVGEILLYFYVPMFSWKDFLDGTDQENSKTQGGKGQIRKIQKRKRKKEWRKEKEEIFTEGPIQVGSPLVGNALGLLPSC